MSLGTPSRERKKTTANPPSSKNAPGPSTKSGTKPNKDTKSGKTEVKSTKTSSRVKTEKVTTVKPSKLAVKSSKNEKENVKSKVEQVSKRAVKVSPKPIFKPPTPPSPADEEIYEDDFEDYSDDFESDASESSAVSRPYSAKINRSSSPPVKSSSPSEKQVVTKKLEDEDEVEDLPLEIPEDTPMLRRLGTAQGRREPPPPTTAPPQQRRESRVLSATERKIDFWSAQNYDLVAMSNSEKRYQKLREMITFDTQTFVVLDKPPVKDYDFYMQLFGDRGKMQTAAQTRDDDISQSVQTEAPSQRTVWTQAPAVGGDWGGEEGIRGEKDDGMSIFRENHLANERLKAFMETASQVILDLMASRRRGGKLLDLGERNDQAFSAGYKCTAITKDERGNQTVSAAFLVEESAASDIEGRSLIVETIVDSSRPPERLCLCDAEISAMCYSPDGSALFVGMKDGSVAGFDFLESDLSFGSSLPWIDSQVDLVLRRPSFDTSFLAAALTADGAAPIVSISSTNTQVSALDSAATLFLYGIQRDDSPTLGKTAGARLFLTLTAIIKPDPAVLKSANQPTPLIATCMAVAGDGQYVVGTDAGFLCSMSRNKSASNHVGPRLYRGKMQSFGEITALRTSPHDRNMLLTGLSTGSLQLIRLDQAVPLLILSPPGNVRQAVTSVEWSPTSNTGFYSWHGGIKILFWDISIAKTPITISDLSLPIVPGVTITWLESSDQRIGFMAQAAMDGSLEIHALEPPKNNKMRIGSAVRSLEM